MKALLLAAGVGSRLAPLTTLLPKCMMPIHGYPLLEYWLASLSQCGVNEIILNVHHHYKMVQAYIENSPYRRKVKICYEDQLLGTAGTLWNQREALGGDPFLVIYADNLSAIDMKSFVDCFEQREKEIAMTMMTFDSDSPSSCGIVELDECQRVVGFHEKVKNPPSNHANGAVYLMDQPIFAHMSKCNIDAHRDSPVDLSIDLIPDLLGKINCWHNDVYHRDIGSLDSYLIARNSPSVFDEVPLSKNAFWECLLPQRDALERLIDSLRACHSIKQAIEPDQVAPAST